MSTATPTPPSSSTNAPTNSNAVRSGPSSAARRAAGRPRFGEMLRPEMRGMDVAPIHVEIDDDLATWRAEVPGRVTAAAEALTGPTTADGARVQVHNAPGAEVGPGQVATWGRATVDRADAFGFTWDRSGKSSKHFPFDWSGPD